MDLTSDWKSSEKAVTKVSNRHRRRELDEEAVFKRSPSPESKFEAKTKEEQKAEPSVAVEDLSELMRNLTILTTQFVETNGQPQAVAAPEAKGQSLNTSWPCMWCDSTAHTKRECTELDEAVKKGLVKFVGEVGMKKIAFPDNEEPIPFNHNKGGMKALAERRAGKRPAEASTSQAEANVFYSEVEPKFGSIAYKKQLADRIREKSGWDAPVLFSSITMEVGAAWDANVDDKRKSGKAEGETRRKEKRRKDEMGASTPAPPPPPASVPESEMKEIEKPVRKSLGWILRRDVDQSVFPEVMAQKFWNQPVQGFTVADMACTPPMSAPALPNSSVESL
ncbi:unnamed protein product [Calypogeia fissa]